MQESKILDLNTCIDCSDLLRFLHSRCPRVAYEIFGYFWLFKFLGRKVVVWDMWKGSDREKRKDYLRSNGDVWD